jgi:dTDP-4-amino-4,6-dideoxygalactose transaminase
MNHIPFLDIKPYGSLASELSAAYDRVVNSGRYIGGNEVGAFESEWADYCGVNYCVGTGNGHDALMLACKFYAENHRPECGVAHVPWKTCLPTYSAVKNGGLAPIPFTGKSIGISIDVHIYGVITLSDDLYHLPEIEDCAQAHGAMLHGKKAGQFGSVASWSFYPTKCLGALGDAGAVTTNDEEIADFVRSQSNYGTRSDIGVNSRLDPLQAAFLRVKLPYLDRWNARRRQNAQAYLDTIWPDAGVVLPFASNVEEPCWHIFAIETDNRDSLRHFLAQNGVETMIHYPQVPYHPVYRIPEAEAWTQRTLSLPVAPHVTPEQCKQIGELINQWMTSRV